MSRHDLAESEALRTTSEQDLARTVIGAPIDLISSRGTPAARLVTARVLLVTGSEDLAELNVAFRSLSDRDRELLALEAC